MTREEAIEIVKTRFDKWALADEDLTALQVLGLIDTESEDERVRKALINVFAAHPVEKSPNWRKSNKVYLEVCGCYVHELQHALRLCGIEKEIKI